MIDTVIICVLCLAIGGSIFWTIRNKLKGKTSCGCDCANCHACSSCRTKKEDK